MAVIYAPKMDFVGRAVYDIDLVIEDGLIRAALVGESQLDVPGDLRLSQIIHDFTGESTLTVGSLKADTSIPSEDGPVLTGQSTLTAKPPKNASFRADLTGSGDIEVEPVRSSLTGAGALSATITGGQGVVFASRDLSGSGALTATTQPITHSVQAQPMTATAHLGVVGDSETFFEDPVALGGASVLTANFGLLPGYDSRVTQLTGTSTVRARARKIIPIRIKMIANGVLAESRKTVTTTATMEQTSSASGEAESLTVVPSGPHTEYAPITRADQGYDALDVSASTRRQTEPEPVDRTNTGYDLLVVSASSRREFIDEPGVGTPLVVGPVADQSANEGQTLGEPPATVVLLDSVATGGSGFQYGSYNPVTKRYYSGGLNQATVYAIDTTNENVLAVEGTLTNTTNFQQVNGVAVDETNNRIFVGDRVKDNYTTVDTSALPMTIAGAAYNQSGPGGLGDYAAGVLYAVDTVTDSFKTLNVAGNGDITLLDSVTNSTTMNAAEQVLYVPELNAAFVSGGLTSHIQAVNVTDPNAITLAGSYDTGTSLADTIGAFDAARNLLYWPTYNGNSLLVLDVSDINAITLVGSLVDAVNLVRITAVHYDDRYQRVLYAGDQYAGVIDVATPASPTLLDSVSDVALDATRGNVGFDPERNVAFFCTSNGSCHAVQMYGAA